MPICTWGLRRHQRLVGRACWEAWPSSSNFPFLFSLSVDRWCQIADFQTEAIPKKSSNALALNLRVLLWHPCLLSGCPGQPTSGSKSVSERTCLCLPVWCAQSMVSKQDLDSHSQSPILFFSCGASSFLSLSQEIVSRASSDAPALRALAWARRGECSYMPATREPCAEHFRCLRSAQHARDVIFCLVCLVCQ